jgi:hypothetical protein
MFRDLADQSVKRDTEADAWLEQRRSRLLAPDREDSGTNNDG